MPGNVWNLPISDCHWHFTHLRKCPHLRKNPQQATFDKFLSGTMLNLSHRTTAIAFFFICLTEMDSPSNSHKRHIQSRGYRCFLFVCFYLEALNRPRQCFSFTKRSSHYRNFTALGICCVCLYAELVNILPNLFINLLSLSSVPIMLVYHVKVRNYSAV